VNETQTEPKTPFPALTLMPTSRVVCGERRGDLLGAEPGPVPADRGGQPSSACKFVLVGLAITESQRTTCICPSRARSHRRIGSSDESVVRLGRLAQIVRFWVYGLGWAPGSEPAVTEKNQARDMAECHDDERKGTRSSYSSALGRRPRCESALAT
jgi:hypothetical protein